MKTIHWVLIAVGTVGLGVGAYFLLKPKGGKDENGSEEGNEKKEADKPAKKHASKEEILKLKKDYTEKHGTDNILNEDSEDVLVSRLQKLTLDEYQKFEKLMWKPESTWSSGELKLANSLLYKMGYLKTKTNE